MRSWFAIATGRLLVCLAAMAAACAAAQAPVRGRVAGLPTFAPVAARALPATLGVWGVVQRSSSCDVPGPGPEPGPPAASTGSQALGLKIGAGFVIDGDGHAVTAAHVVQGCSRVAVELWDQRVVVAEKIGEDRAADVALLKLPLRLPAPALRRAPLRPGDWVLSIGHPYGLSRSVGIGIVAAVDRHFPDDSGLLFIQSDLVLNVGSSGGPLVDANGAIAGMNVRSVVGGQGMVAGLSLPIGLVLQTVAELRRDDDAEPRPRLGAQFDDLPPPAALALGLRSADGVLITKVEATSLAERFGLEEGDLVVGMNGRWIRNSADFVHALLGWTDPGTTRLMVLRDGGYRELALGSGGASSAELQPRPPTR